jgi:hypothetical protein
MIPVYLEIGAKKTFALAVDWPGWARSAKTPDGAIEALAGYEGRYRMVVEGAGEEWPEVDGFDVVEEVAGNASTDFGAPGAVPDLDRSPLDGRLVTLWRACWETFDRVAAAAPEELRKGPRGGGRDTSKMIAHVDEADRAYARQMRVKPGEIPTSELRAAMVAAALTPAADAKWPPRYLIRRSAWHALDHAWEIEDRS